jgi:hypothetical protein
MPALIWIMPCRVSVLSAVASSEAVMVLSSPVICPPAGMMHEASLGTIWIALAGSCHSGRPEH